MSSPRPQQNLSTVEANRQFYASVAAEYDRTEQVVADARLTDQLRAMLERALRELPDEPRVLDACGGSGNASLALLVLGVRPLTLDVSPEMLTLFERKARTGGHEPATQLADVDRFLEEDPREWDLIVFSSALHHLEAYAVTLESAIKRLAPGGIILTMFDPTRVDSVGRRLRRLDYIAHVVVKTPRRLPAILRGRLSGDDPSEKILGELAERHALEGIDDFALRRLFERHGLEILAHLRLHEGRFRLTRRLFRLLRRPSAFQFLVRRPGFDASGERSARATRAGRAR